MLLSAMRQPYTGTAQNHRSYSPARRLFLATSGGLTARRMSATARAGLEVGVSTKDE